MVQKVEESFNFVWRVEQPRSFGRRFSEYLSVMVVGPALIVAAFGLIAAFANTSAIKAISQYEPFGTGLVMFGRLTPYILVTGVFTFMYAFIPNTRCGCGRRWREACSAACCGPRAARCSPVS